MTPKSFDEATAKEWVGDFRMRKIETKAREDAEKNHYDPPNRGATFSSYMAQVDAQMVDNVYFNAFKKRRDRIQRMEERAHLLPA